MQGSTFPAIIKPAEGGILTARLREEHVWGLGFQAGHEGSTAHGLGWASYVTEWGTRREPSLWPPEGPQLELTRPVTQRALLLRHPSRLPCRPPGRERGVTKGKPRGNFLLPRPGPLLALSASHGSCHPLLLSPWAPSLITEETSDRSVMFKTGGES